METSSLGTYSDAKQLARGPALDPVTAWPRLVASFALKGDGVKGWKPTPPAKGCGSGSSETSSSRGAGADDAVKEALAPYVQGEDLDGLLTHIAQRPHWYYTGPLYPLHARMASFRLLVARCMPRTAAAMRASSLLGDDCLEVSMSRVCLLHVLILLSPACPPRYAHHISCSR